LYSCGTSSANSSSVVFTCGRTSDTSTGALQSSTAVLTCDYE
jgi:hypothetical protein